VDHYARAYSVFSRIRGYRRYVEMLHSLKYYEQSEVAGQRMRIIRFYDTYGERATKEAFGADRKLIHVWRKRLREAEGKLAALVPHSTRPRRTRQMQVEPRVVEFYCGSTGLPAVSVSTIGKVIKRHKLFFQRSGKVYHDPRNAERYAKKTKRLRVKRSLRHREFGHFQADSSVRFIDGLRRYLISAIDSRLKFSFSNCYSTLTSRNSRDFLRRLEVVYPLKIRSVQTDNGAEFLGDFDSYLTKKGIPHYFSYPRCPKINGCVERFNRTLKVPGVLQHPEASQDSRPEKPHRLPHLGRGNVENVWNPYTSLTRKRNSGIC
jgi:transposase InsO family protein